MGGCRCSRSGCIQWCRWWWWTRSPFRPTQLWPLPLSCPQPLIHIMGSDDETLQEAAAGCVRNIRLLALANRNAQLFYWQKRISPGRPVDAAEKWLGQWPFETDFPAVGIKTGFGPFPLPARLQYPVSFMGRTINFPQSESHIAEEPSGGSCLSKCCRSDGSFCCHWAGEQRAGSSSVWVVLNTESTLPLNGTLCFKLVLQ